MRLVKNCWSMALHMKYAMQQKNSTPAKTIYSGGFRDWNQSSWSLSGIFFYHLRLQQSQSLLGTACDATKEF